MSIKEINESFSNVRRPQKISKKQKANFKVGKKTISYIRVKLHHATVKYPEKTTVLMMDTIIRDLQHVIKSKRCLGKARKLLHSALEFKHNLEKRLNQ